MNTNRAILFLLLALSFVAIACGNDKSDENLDHDAVADDDDDSAEDDDNDTTIGDDDDDDDDAVEPDDYLAPWPQDAVETQDYDETSTSGPLRVKAETYDTWNEANAQPFYGAQMNVKFTDDTHTEVERYHRFNDSCLLTGTYLGAQAMRYYVTGNSQAKANAVRAVEALAEQLHVTGRTGFIARYRGPQNPLVYDGDAWCDETDRCHRIESSPYTGDFWWGETSRDQYTGWFFGMAVAYDLADDEDLRDQIRDMVSEVLNTLIDDRWLIIDEEGRPTDAAPNVTPPFRLAWLIIGYHLTGEERLGDELRFWLRDEQRQSLRLSSIAFFNRYSQYYGNNLSHTNWYNLLRLGKAYFSDDDYSFMLNLFEAQVHTFTRLSHNAWFNGIFMSQGDYAPARYDEYQAQLEEVLIDFRDAPMVYYYLPERTGYTLDPVSVFLHDLQEDFPWLENLIGSINYQAEDALPILEQCSGDFIFKTNPFEIDECGEDDPSNTRPGVDYIAAYWLASYHKFLERRE